MKNQSQNAQDKIINSNEQDDVFIGRRGHAIDFFEDYQEELIKYAKTKGMISKGDANEMKSLLNEISNEICDGVVHMSWERVQELNRKIEQLLKQAEEK